jgi:hypothetical protein
MNTFSRRPLHLVLRISLIFSPLLVSLFAHPTVQKGRNLESLSPIHHLPGVVLPNSLRRPLRSLKKTTLQIWAAATLDLTMDSAIDLASKNSKFLSSLGDLIFRS